ncbi:MAG: TlyA family RNA methyltransferase [Oligoflexia bacterium]|nr:TlyA family RNA methyltransferase [Oligoflexia bacterium]
MAKPSEKTRIDVLLVERGLAPTRERAQSMIIAGQVLVGDTPATKPGQAVAKDAEIRVRGEDHPYVSRGGIKLAAALDAFQVPVQGRVGLDVGASTGGFTHVLLLRDASKVFAVDVGHNQLDWKIRNDPRVIVHEKVNARNLAFETVGQKVDLIVMDVSFISLDKILPALIAFATPETDWITLIKPQFEVGREHVGKGGIVTSEDARQQAVERLRVFAETLGLNRLGLIESPITGTQGNKEFLAHWRLKTTGENAS